MIMVSFYRSRGLKKYGSRAYRDSLWRQGLGQSPRSATIRPVENVSIYVISGRSLDELLGEMPHTGHKIKHNIALSVAKTVRSMNDLLSRELHKNQLLHRKASELGTHKYNQTITNLAYHIHLSA